MPFRLFLMLVLPFVPLLANAQVRTWVSGDGLDSNPCTRSAPCRNFDAAINAVAAGGEVVALDSAGYGPISITKPVEVIAPAGIHAAIAPTSGEAIQILEADVVIRGLYLNSRGAIRGISIDGNATNIHVESCVISGFSTHGLFMRSGISGGRLYVIDSVFRSNSNMSGNAAGVLVQGTNVLNVASFDLCRFEGNNYGLIASNNSQVTVRDSVAVGGTWGFFGQATIQGQPADLNVVRSVAAHQSNAAIYSNNALVTITVANSAALSSNTGIQSSLGTIRIGGSTVSRNNTGLSFTGGSIISFGNNQVNGNVTDGAPSSTIGTI